MQFPYFAILNYGAYNSSRHRNKGEEGRDVLASAYEFELYAEDCEGGRIINGTFYPARKGYFSCCKPGQRQKMIHPYKCWYFNISTQDEALCDLLDHLPEMAMLVNWEEVQEYFCQMLAVENTTSMENRLRLQSCILRILSILAEPGQTLSSNAMSARGKDLRMVDKYIREHYAEDLTLESLAALCNLNPHYFHRLYTAAFGKTPAQRILGCRIAAARTALLTDNSPISEIAARCGFSSQTYFGYRFKEITGCTPLEYRAEMLSKRNK